MYFSYVSLLFNSRVTHISTTHLLNRYLTETMPRVYVDGVYIGGIDELEATVDCGNLKQRIKLLPRKQERDHCQDCYGSGRVFCQRCCGRQQHSDCDQVVSRDQIFVELMSASIVR